MFDESRRSLSVAVDCRLREAHGELRGDYEGKSYDRSNALTEPLVEGDVKSVSDGVDRTPKIDHNCRKIEMGFWLYVHK